MRTTTWSCGAVADCKMKVMIAAKSYLEKVARRAFFCCLELFLHGVRPHNSWPVLEDSAKRSAKPCVLPAADGWKSKTKVLGRKRASNCCDLITPPAWMEATVSPPYRGFTMGGHLR